MNRKEIRPWDERVLNVDDVLSRIKDYIVRYKVPVHRWFQEFDHLNSGSITKPQFIRSLSSFGMSSLGKLHLSSHEVALICCNYQDPKLPGNILWLKFADDLYSVFYAKGLEKDPTRIVMPAEAYLLVEQETPDISRATTDQMVEIKCALKTLKDQVDSRRIDMLPVFKDFDKPNFRSVLGNLNLSCTEEEMKVLEAVFVDAAGFNYNRFLNEIQPSEIEIPDYPNLNKRLWQLQSYQKFLEYKAAGNLQEVLFKIRTKVWERRIRVKDFLMDFDKPKHGRILKTHFRRGLDTATFELQESEMAILANAYQSEIDPDYVNYFKFCDDIESVFTQKHLEKNPLLHPVQFKTVHSLSKEMNQLTPDEEKLLLEGMERMAIKVKREQTPLLYFFHVLDHLHSGFVTSNQFDRTLSNLGFLELFTPQELAVVHKKFTKEVNKIDMMYYFEFSKQMSQLAGISFY